MTAEGITAAATVAGVIVAAAGVIVAIVALYLAKGQLVNLNQTLKMNGLMAVLQMEADMNSRKQRLDELTGEIARENAAEKPNKKLIEAIGTEMNAALENWLNAADRLAYCILNGYLHERDWRAEYRGYFADIVSKHVHLFQADSIYTNILDLNDKWKRE